MRARAVRFAACVCCVLGAMALTACNTVEGAGEDIQSLGEAMQDAAK